MENVAYAHVEGYQTLVDLFGYWPLFHDAQIRSIAIDPTGPTITMALLLESRPSEKDADAADIQVTLRWQQVERFQLTFQPGDDSQENYLNELTIHFQSGVLTTHLEPLWGIGGQIRSRRMEVVRLLQQADPTVLSEDPSFQDLPARRRSVWRRHQGSAAGQDDETEAGWVSVFTTRMRGPLGEVYHQLKDSLVTTVLRDHGIAVRYSRPVFRPAGERSTSKWRGNYLDPYWDIAYLVPEAQAEAARSLIAEIEQAPLAEEDQAMFEVDPAEDTE